VAAVVPVHPDSVYHPAGIIAVDFDLFVVDVA
jgi:hypothetical protein